jgi:shikimate dehydrogenase
VPDPLAVVSASSIVWLFGHPVGHSLSPLMQNAAFRHRGLDVGYIARDVHSDALTDAVEALRSPHFRGANLTLPHKEAALSLVDDVAPEAARIGAVNTIVNDGGTLRGYNTDSEGFLSALRIAAGEGAAGLECLVLGAGGAARAVVAALVQDRAARVWVANRTRQRAETLCQAATAWGGSPCVPIAFGEVSAAVDSCQVVINATSLGLPHSVKDLPIDVDTLHSGQVLVDLVYGLQTTALVKEARARGLVAVDGKEMLVQQAALSFQLWTGIEAPLDIMRGSIGSC